MAVTKRGLGRGLDALLGGGSEESGDAKPSIKELSVASIRPNPKQPRQDFTKEALEELAESIKAKGVLQPILVRPVEGERDVFELVAGERRWRAAGLAELETVPAMVRVLTDEESLALALIENLQREDLNPIEEARGYQRLLEEFGISQEELARQMGKSRSAVANCVRLLKLPDNILTGIRDGQLSAGHGRSLMSVDDPVAREKLYHKILKHSMSVRQSEADAAYFKEHGVLPEATAAAPAQKTGTSGPKEPKILDEALARLSEELGQALSARVRITGNLHKGSISFHYKNPGQLAELAERLGCEPVEDGALEDAVTP